MTSGEDFAGRPVLSTEARIVVTIDVGCSR
jgi:hypothetical protein